MPEKEWLFSLEDGEHRVKLKHSNWIRRYHVELDNRTINTTRTIIKGGDKLSFEINLHKCVIVIRFNKNSLDYDLIVDDTSIEKNKKTEIPPEWNRPRPGCLKELFSYTIFTILIGIVSGLSGYSSDKIIGLVVGAILLYAALRYLMKRRQ
ncbi:hypothetical protein Desor_1883 [Desulfosporosinus orientis DSM 765]|uniref:Uncharacterized protein n=1 Tax=Desulfosporosinus orientis (strain ATCC 19365 / DSM 765 / NCIMB 8382 / VKM B-1628 / Singapore I) TaxID=768706 RepID=G7WB13_DESOD|nr:hypothetical protein [Desulfosporosinus orientis]AET67514.1 hypothetical protein Desor_1883 [Desulfosporosinus orientis DSM 765]